MIGGRVGPSALFSKLVRGLAQNDNRVLHLGFELVEENVPAQVGTPVGCNKGLFPLLANGFKLGRGRLGGVAPLICCGEGAPDVRPMKINIATSITTTMA